MEYWKVIRYTVRWGLHDQLNSFYPFSKWKTMTISNVFVLKYHIMLISILKRVSQIFLSLTYTYLMQMSNASQTGHLCDSITTGLTDQNLQLLTHQVVNGFKDRLSRCGHDSLTDWDRVTGRRSHGDLAALDRLTACRITTGRHKIPFEASLKYIVPFEITVIIY